MKVNGRRCPFCGAKNAKVLDKRSFNDKSSNWRRLGCVECHRRWSTYERWDGVQDPYKKRPEKGAATMFQRYQPKEKRV